MGEELGTTVNQNMGEELGNYVHQNYPVSTPTPPVEFWDTHRQTVTLLSTPTPPVEFWDTHRQRERVTLYGGGARNYR